MQIVKHLRIFTISASLFVIFLIAGCSEDPSSVGDEVMSNLGLEITSAQVAQDNSTTIFTKDSTIKQVTALGVSDRLLIGQYLDHQASTLIKFAPYLTGRSSQILNDSVLVKSARIAFYHNYTLGDSNAAFGINAKRVQANWTASTFTTDSIGILNPRNENIASDFKLDSALHYYSFAIDPAVVRLWLKASVDTAAEQNYGVLLGPSPAAAKLMGFDAFAYGVTAYPILYYTVNKSDNSGDTTHSVYAINNTTFVTGSVPTGTNDLFYVQSGVTLRSLLWFDLSSVPKDAIINKATLEVRKSVDAARSYTGSAFSDQLNAYFVADSVKDSISADYASALKPADSVYSGDVTQMVTEFYAAGKNALFQLTTGDFLRGCDRLALYGSKALNSWYRPKLNLIYSRKAR